jgi:hypothetical protein
MEAVVEECFRGKLKREQGPREKPARRYIIRLAEDEQTAFLSANKQSKIRQSMNRD